jgi:hypothetical protein
MACKTRASLFAAVVVVAVFATLVFVRSELNSDDARPHFEQRPFAAKLAAYVYSLDPPPGYSLEKNAATPLAACDRWALDGAARVCTSGALSRAEATWRSHDGSVSVVTMAGNSLDSFFSDITTARTVTVRGNSGKISLAPGGARASVLAWRETRDIVVGIATDGQFTVARLIALAESGALAQTDIPAGLAVRPSTGGIAKALILTGEVPGSGVRDCLFPINTTVGSRCYLIDQDGRGRLRVLRLGEKDRSDAVVGGASLATHELRGFRRDGTSFSIVILGGQQHFGELYWINSDTNIVKIEAMDRDGRLIGDIRF